MIQVREMNLADVPLGMQLKAAAGWNQTEADWRRFLDLQPDGCFVASFDGVDVGTLTTCIFGTVAWIAMVLVDAECRGRGIGGKLMNHALEFLDQQGVSSVRLDATLLGRPLYEKLGFAADYGLHRYSGVLASAAPVPEVATMQSANMSALLHLDREATGTDRHKLLLRWASEFPETIRIARGPSGVEGYCVSRRGSTAVQLGPCIATEAAGRRLLEDAVYHCRGQTVFIDIPDRHGLAIRWAEEAGLTAQRPLLRMYRGLKLGERVDALWASSGPEMG